MNQVSIPLCAVVGPTATGKTDLAVALARRNNGEIISFDSMQIYKDAPIATAVPTVEERRGIPHHLMEFVSADEQFSVARYTALAKETIAKVHEKGKLPVLVGGTGLYYSSLLNNIRFSRQTEDQPQVRRQLQQRLAEEGISPLYQELRSIDPQAAAAIHINNHVRVLRALEIYYTTGKTMTRQAEESHAEPSPYRVCAIGLTYHDRALLYQRINRRVEKMMEAGLVDEVKRLYDMHPKGTILQAIGVKEFAPYWKGEATLEEVVAQIQAETRRYAKRQLTWFRRDRRVQWLYRDDPACETDLAGEAQKLLDAWVQHGFEECL